MRELEAEPRVVGAKDLGAGLGRKGGGVERLSQAYLEDARAELTAEEILGWRFLTTELTIPLCPELPKLAVG